MVAEECLKIQVLLFRYGQASRGQEEGTHQGPGGGVGGLVFRKHPGWPGGEMWSSAFVVVSSGRKGQGRVSTFRIGYFESFQQALGQRSCP